MTSSARVVTLKCKSCGANLQITPDMEQFACGYCGSEQIIERRGGTISLKPVIDAIAKVQISTDKAAAELAITRLEKQLETVEERYQAQSHIVDNPATPRADIYVWALVLICIGIYFLTRPGGTTPGLLWLGVAGLIVLYIICRSLVTQNGRREQEEELSRIALELAHIRNTLEANHKIVNS